MTDQTAIVTDEPKEEKALTRITSYMEAPIVRARFAQMMGERGASTYINSILLSVAESAALQKCTPVSIYTQALRAATLRLSVDPGIGQAYMVPFNDKATLIVGYKGLHDMAVRTGKYRYINVGPVYEGEEMVVDRLSGLHKAPTGHRTSNTVIGWIGAFELYSGYAHTLYMTVEELHEHAACYSKGYDYKDKAGKFTSLWHKEPAAMERKTVLRLLLRHWGYMDPSDVQVLDEIEEDESKDAPSEFNGLAQAIEGRVVDDGLPRSKEEAVRELGFTGNPDPIDDKSWGMWEALVKRADAVKVPHSAPERERTTKADLRTEYNDLKARVVDAEAQAKAGEERQDAAD